MFLECEHFTSIVTNTITITVKITRIETAITGPIMAAVLSGLPGEAVGVEVIVTDPGGRVRSCVSPDPSLEPSVRVG